MKARKEGSSGAKPKTKSARCSGKGKGTSGNKGGAHSGKGTGLTTVEAAALMDNARLVAVNKGKKGKEGGTQAEVDTAQAALAEAVEQARKAESQHAVAKKAVDERRRRLQQEEDVEQDDSGGGVGVEARVPIEAAVKRAKIAQTQAKKRPKAEEAEESDAKKVKKEKDAGDGDGSEPWHWQNVMKGSSHMGKDGVFDIEGFSEVQVRHGPQVQQ